MLFLWIKKKESHRIQQNNAITHPRNKNRGRVYGFVDNGISLLTIIELATFAFSAFDNKISSTDELRINAMNAELNAEQKMEKWRTWDKSMGK